MIRGVGAVYAKKLGALSARRRRLTSTQLPMGDPQFLQNEAGNKSLAVAFPLM
jgi:hypothetical protein